VNNEKSYSELVKAHSLKKSKAAATIQELLIEMIIHESILINQRKNLEKQIDNALDTKNKPLFLRLSAEMNCLLKQFGA
jgi:uncharacterized protein YpiB (UPF0302 family)